MCVHLSGIWRTLCENCDLKILRFFIGSDCELLFSENYVIIWRKTVIRGKWRREKRSSGQQYIQVRSRHVFIASHDTSDFDISSWNFDNDVMNYHNFPSFVHNFVNLLLFTFQKDSRDRNGLFDAGLLSCSPAMLACDSDVVFIDNLCILSFLAVHLYTLRLNCGWFFYIVYY